MTNLSENENEKGMMHSKSNNGNHTSFNKEETIQNFFNSLLQKVSSGSGTVSEVISKFDYMIRVMDCSKSAIR